eukprot:6138958-Pleurochrysis_carterae.AAC.1
MFVLLGVSWHGLLRRFWHSRADDARRSVGRGDGGKGQRDSAVRRGGREAHADKHRPDCAQQRAEGANRARDDALATSWRAVGEERVDHRNEGHEANREQRERDHEQYHLNAEAHIGTWVCCWIRT